VAANLLKIGTISSGWRWCCGLFSRYLGVGNLGGFCWWGLGSVGVRLPVVLRWGVPPVLFRGSWGWWAVHIRAGGWRGGPSRGGYSNGFPAGARGLGRRYMLLLGGGLRAFRAIGDGRQQLFRIGLGHRAAEVAVSLNAMPGCCAARRTCGVGAADPGSILFRPMGAGLRRSRREYAGRRP